MSSARVATLNRLTKRTDTDEPQPRDTISTLHGAPPVKYEGTLRKRIKERLEQIIETAELIGLLVTGIGTALAMGHLIWTMANSGDVTLTDLLLMFLYLEVFAMVGQYLKAGQLPVRFPLYIAMVSIARDVILRAGTNTNLHLVASAGAIVLIALGVLLIRYGQSKYPSHTNERPEDGGH
ncbi:phosphate-starvation-inducible protein PsiE [Paraburkholderia phenazinium]|jgi:protein PsiE|uniref:phosphate-starvation-inducible protein PsiE n=1 Tax=Paraburkholderia phenazinium TaxID=60549 RepID=UPI00155372F6|nr:phosphate-starvation-inducible PsiE family protein [Paraburkholderia phenazinium]